MGGGAGGADPAGDSKTKQEGMEAFEVARQRRGWGRGRGSHLVPVAVLRNHVHQQDVLGAGDEPGQADLAVGEHPPGRPAHLSGRARRSPGALACRRPRPPTCPVW